MVSLVTELKPEHHGTTTGYRYGCREECCKAAKRISGSNQGVSRHNYATRKLYDKHKNPLIRSFVGVDGEGGNVPEEGTLFDEIVRHQYLSLRIGPELLETGKPLNYRECFNFICDQSQWNIYVAYFFDYDVTMMIRTLPRERAARLLNRHLRTNPKNGAVLPLDVDDYFQIEYLPHKEFKVRRKNELGKWEAWRTISDVGQFFQTSFVSTLEKWNIGTEEERQMIRTGKAQRANFTQFTDETRAYNALEVLLLEQLMEEFREVCIAVGYVPKKWQGPGNLASALLTRHRIPKRDEIHILRNDTFRALAQAAYYGGRFETTASGPIPGPVYQYDINGAYVALLRGLPCLLHGTWKQVSARPDPGTIWFGEIYFHHMFARGSERICNLPVRRNDGTIYYPHEGNGVYWGVEIEAAERVGTSILFRQGWVYESHCNCSWFDFVDQLYAERLRLGKTAKGYVLKLAGNSVYGKLAQSIGYAPWANPVWAGLITAGCRAMLTDAYGQAPNQCYMLATDGLFMAVPLDLPCSKKLGEWEATVHASGMFIVQPGVYFLGESGEVKTRGVERGRITGMRDEFEKQFHQYVESHGLHYPVSVEVDNFITARQAIQRNNWKLAGTWDHTIREISFYWDSKRAQGVAQTIDGVLRTVPLYGGADVHSVAYARLIGGGLSLGWDDKYSDLALIEGQRMAEQPDWAPSLFDRE